MKTRTKLMSALMTAIMSIGIATTSFAKMPTWGEEYKNQPTKNYEQTFKDVDKNYWAFSYIGEMVTRGVLSGYNNGCFYPDNNVTRAEFAKIMTVAAGLNVTTDKSSWSNYSDISDTAWYGPFVGTARYYLSGYSVNGELYYLPEQYALREDIAVALVKLKGYDTSIYDESILKAMFKDWQSISSSARKYVAVAVEQGLISGYDDDTFRGQEGITRAEASTLLWRAYQYGSGNKVFEKEEIESTSKPIVTPVPTVAPTKAPEKTQEPEEIEPTKAPTPKPTKTPTPEPEYLYSVKTISNNVKDIGNMCTDNKGNIYYISDKKKIMKATKNGIKSNAILESSNIGFLDDEKHSKGEDIPDYDIIALGYNETENSLYCLLYDKRNCYLYNIETGSYNEITKASRFTGPFEDTMNMMSYAYMECTHPMQFLNSGENIIYVNGISIEDFVITDYPWQKYATVGDTLCMFDRSTIRSMNNRSGKFEDVYNIGYRESLLSYNNNYFYIVKDDENIYRVTLDGDKELVMNQDDVDNVDNRSVKFLSMYTDYMCIDDDGTIYYWDPNYSAIRQITKN